MEWSQVFSWLPQETVQKKPFNVIETWVGVHSITNMRNLKLQ